jgi:hypothetical protein
MPEILLTRIATDDVPTLGERNIHQSENEPGQEIGSRGGQGEQDKKKKYNPGY